MTSDSHTSSAFWQHSPEFVPSVVQVQYSGTASAQPEGGEVAAAVADTRDSASRPLSAHTLSPRHDSLGESSGRASHRSSGDMTGGGRGSVDSSNSEAKAQGPAAKKFHAVLSAQTVDLGQLQQLSWKGIPAQYRSTAWQLLMGYLPLDARRRAGTLQRKRKEYADWVRQTFGRGEELLDQVLWHQIRIDVPRTAPGSPVFQEPRIQRCLERILYCWAARHPASGYVQGINDLLTPFVYVFLHPHVEDAGALDDAALGVVEADSFWCLTKLLDGIQDNYTHAQPGIQRSLVKMKDLVARIDSKLATHLDREDVQFIQFAFRWINCLLMREVSLASTVRMWDTYLAEPDGFASFHIYVCAAFLLKWSRDLQAMDFQNIVEFLQHPPSKDWAVADVDLLLSEAYMYKCLYHGSPSHYAPTPQR